jgi:hypothetical protein
MSHQPQFHELFADKTGNWVGRSAMCSALQKLGLNRKKKTTRSTQAGTERVLNLRLDYWAYINTVISHKQTLKNIIT